VSFLGEERVSNLHSQLAGWPRYFLPPLLRVSALCGLWRTSTHFFGIFAREKATQCTIKDVKRQQEEE
jgi:hypothetical protein